MDWFPLPIFPEGSLSNSVFTTVWVGVMVFSFFNLRLGWVYSGLVVPGYLIPLAMEKPWVAVVVIFEAILTLWTVKGMMYLLPKLGLACEWFGRDRFFAMILVSAFYRLSFDVWLLPALGVFLRDELGIIADFSNTLHSFGLIVICLLANQLFKTGVLRGAIPFLVISSITWVIIRYGLMTFTNFNLTSLSFLYEDVAASIYAAPKAYIVLITAAIVSSWMNLRYGWDFNGIMIPALLSLQWYEPLKIATSIVEALIILYVSMLLLKVRPFNQMTMEGARKVMLFFTVSFVYKIAVGWGLYFIAPEVKSTDYYGFGYLLPTLMAIKMHALNKVAHQIRIVVQVSLLSVGAANLVGFALLLVPPFFQGAPSGTPTDASPRFVKIDRPASELFREGAFEILFPPTTEQATVRRHEAAYHFERLITELLKDQPSQDRISELLANSQCRSLESSEGSVVITSSVEGREILLLIDPTAGNELILKAPGFQNDVRLIPAIWNASSFLNPRFILLSDDYRDSEAKDLHPFVARLHDQFANGGIVELSTSLDEVRPRVLNRLPRDLELASLREIFPGLNFAWSSRSELDLAPLPVRGGYLHLSIPDNFPIDAKPANPEKLESAEARFEDLISLTLPVFEREQDTYEPASLGELRLMNDLVITPALALSQAPSFDDKLSALSHHAEFLDYQITRFEDLLFISDVSSPPRFRGGLALRIPSANKRPPDAPLTVLQIASRSFADGLTRKSLASLLEGSCDIVIWAQTASDSDPSGLTELTRLENKNSVLHLTHEAVLRAYRDNPLAVFQLSSLVPQQNRQAGMADIQIVSNDYVTAGGLPSVIDRWQARAREGGFKTAFVDTRGEQADLAIGANLQDTAMYLSSPDHAFAKLWISPALRASFGPAESYAYEKTRLRSLGIVEREITSDQVIDLQPPPAHFPDTIRETLSRYRATRNILLIAGLREDPLVSMEMWTCRFFQTPTLALLNDDGAPFLMVNLSEYTTGSRTRSAQTTLTEWLLRQSTFLGDQ